MSGFLTPIINIFRFHKLKMFSVVLFALVFAIAYFPYSDLTDLISKTVSEQTGNRVYLQAENFGLTFSPGLGAKLEDVVVEIQGLPSIPAKSVAVSPSIMALLTQQPDFSARAEEIFGGNLDLAVSPTGKLTEGGVPLQNIQVATEKVALEALGEFLRSMNLPTRFQGALDLQAGVIIDQTFREQPKGTVNFTASNFVYPAQPVPTQMGPLPLPEVKLTQAVGRAAINEGRLTFEQLQLGSAADDLLASVTGDIGLMITQNETGIVPIIGDMNLKVDLTMRPAFLQRLGAYASMADGLLGNYKTTATGGGSRYVFRVRNGQITAP